MSDRSVDPNTRIDRDSRSPGRPSVSVERLRDDVIKDDLVERYLPEPLWRRLSPMDRWWQGRTILVLWALGYPLELAWSYAISAAGEHATELQAWMADLEDARLIADLESSAEVRGDGSHLTFVTMGPPSFHGVS
jgi:hypothetical protein